MSASTELALPSNAVLLGLIGRFDPQKGQLLVVDTFAEIHRQYPATHLLLVGESTCNLGDAYRQEVVARVHALGLTEVVHMRPFTLQPKVAYRALDIFLMASTNETYGMVTIEAMAAGLPLVASAASGSLELLTHGQTGLLFSVGNQQALKTAIEAFLIDPSFAQQLGQRAQQHARAVYSHHRQCEQTEQVLRALPSGMLYP